MAAKNMQDRMVTMARPPWVRPDDAAHHRDDVLGDAGPRHHRAGKDETGDRQERELVDALKEAVGE